MEPAKQVAEWIKRDPDAADASWVREIKATWGSTFEEAREILSSAQQLANDQLDAFNNFEEAREIHIKATWGSLSADFDGKTYDPAQDCD